jgi:putative ABC transport system permease protein
MSVRDRGCEIAVMRSIGFTSGLIMTLLLTESIVTGLAGGLLGCGSAYLLFKVISAGGGPALGPLTTVMIPSYVLAEGLAVAAAIGVFSALFPARNAARRNIVDALRIVA